MQGVKSPSSDKMWTLILRNALILCVIADTAKKKFEEALSSHM
jgi:hypothetical protein